MIGVMVVSHSDMAKGTLNTCDMVLGNHDNCRCICLHDGLESFAKQLYKELDEMMEMYDEVIVISDLKGGTPYNQSLKYKFEKGKERIELLCGFNLPMFAELLTSLPYAQNAQMISEQIVNVAKESIERYQDMEVNNDDDMMFD